jgi:NADH:ubiquinone oxidoreductase subunit 5 (subunit L)/multisubunit Na+/H+ antiporter MnhA subunit
MMDIAWLIPAFPLLGFVLIFLFGRKLGEPFAGVLATFMTAASFVVTALVYFDMVTSPKKNAQVSLICSLGFQWRICRWIWASLLTRSASRWRLFITGIGCSHSFVRNWLHAW